MEVWALNIDEYFQKYQKPLRTIGIFPFTITGNKLEISKLSLILSLIICVFLSILTLTDCLYFDIVAGQPKVLRFLQHILLVSMPVTQIVNTASLIINKDLLASIFTTIKQISYKLPTGNKPDLQIWLPLIYTTLLLMSLASYTIPDGDIVKKLTLLTFHVLSFFNGCTLQLYTNTVVIIKYCFESILLSLKVKKEIAKSLNNLLDCHDNLLNSCDDLNKCFGLLLLSMMTTNFCTLTIVFYHLLKLDSNFYYLGANAIWAIMVSHQVLHLAWATNSTVDKAEEVRSILIGCSYKEANELSFLNVMLLIQNKPVTFTACGLFDINYKMVCSMAAGITTYIVVIFQMGGN